MAYLPRVRAFAVTSAFALAFTPLVIPSTSSAEPSLTPIPQVRELAAAGAEDPVTTRGVVTASYPTGGFFGYYLQTPGTGGDVNLESPSEGIFVYPGKKQRIPEVGECVTITGVPGEYNGLKQVSKVTTTVDEVDCAPVTPLNLEALPRTDAERDAIDGMLVAPQGAYTVTDNYSLNRYGSVGLAFGESALIQPTDVLHPGEEAVAYEADNLMRSVTLDDGSNWNFSKKKEAQNSPLPYLTLDTPVRVGAPVSFTAPVIFEYRFETWNFQPQGQVVGLEGAPATFANTRTSAPASVGEADLKVATFNVLNYFTSLGEDEDGCKGYPDRDGNPISTNRCNVRGAYRAEDFARQEAKIVAAINAMDADIVSLEEIENSSRYGKERDTALAALVKALNADAGEGVWAYVPSPTEVPNNEDAIRTGFIYKPATVMTVGESLISADPAFEGVARSPLAQRFAPVAGEDHAGTEFVVIVNHFKSKGSQLAGEGNEDAFDGQGRNNAARVAQAKALAAFAKDNFAGVPTFLVGDFNSYTREDPMVALSDAGYFTQETPGEYSYMYSGRVGSLDHVVANQEGVDLLTGLTTWEINAFEPVALEYSRYNGNVTDLYAADPYRSSDHNPELFGLKVLTPVTPEPEPVQPGEPGVADPVQPGDPGVVGPEQPGDPGAGSGTAKPTDPAAAAGGTQTGEGLAVTGSAAGLTLLVALALGLAGLGLSTLVRARQ
ncbi:MAG: ExeM/NucH family extracellular endonuclease [Actinomycetaceae bacterium]|nr:ExeM/NucH family extracellular endonuclease [Actinomycetaceae bacterium]